MRLADIIRATTRTIPTVAPAALDNVPAGIANLVMFPKSPSIQLPALDLIPPMFAEPLRAYLDAEDQLAAARDAAPDQIANIVAARDTAWVAVRGAATGLRHDPLLNDARKLRLEAIAAMREAIELLDAAAQRYVAAAGFEGAVADNTLAAQTVKVPQIEALDAVINGESSVDVGGLRPLLAAIEASLARLPPVGPRSRPGSVAG